MQWQPRKENRDGKRRDKPGNQRMLSVPRVCAALLLSGVLIFALVKLIGYGAAWIASRNTAKELKDLYEAVYTDTPGPAEETQTPAPEPERTENETASVSSSPAPLDVSAAQTPIPKLDAVPYPNNKNLEISGRFKALQRESKYIVAWLTVSDLLDEPVAQRNNVFFLDHDAAGRANQNGAIFLDAAVDLKTRPYSLVVYGHNMKTGAMFGSLRNFENSAYYHRSPFITFDTQYENGRYVIFAVGVINVEDAGTRNYVDLYDLNATAIEARQKAIDTLISSSVHTCAVDVRVDDQLLLLVTCVDNDNQRRVVAARRVRDTETEAELQALVQKSRKKQGQK